MRPDLAEVYDDQFDYVWRSLVRLGAPAGELADLSADVWATVALVWSDPQRGYDASRPLRPWLFTITFRTWVDRHRRLRLEQKVMIPALEEPVGPGPSPERRAELHQLAVRLLDGLPEDQRAVLFFAEVEQMTAAEIALEMKLDKSRVEHLLRMARTTLEERVKRLRAREGNGLLGVAPLLAILRDQNAAPPDAAVRARVWNNLPQVIAQRVVRPAVGIAPSGAVTTLGAFALGVLVASLITTAVLLPRREPPAPAPVAVVAASTAPSAHAVAVSSNATGEPSPPTAGSPTAAVSGSTQGAASADLRDDPEYVLLARARTAYLRRERRAALEAIALHRRRFPQGSLAATRDTLERQALALPAGTSATPAP